MQRETVLRLSLGLGVGMMIAAPAWGGSVKATEANPSPSVFSTGGVMNVAAYSAEAGLANDIVTSTVVFGGVAQTAPANYNYGVGVTSQTIFVPNGKMKLNFAGTRMVPDGSFLGPVAQNISGTGLAFSKSKLSAVGDQNTIESQTNAWIGNGSVMNTGAAARGKYTVSAFAISGAAPGNAAGLAGDPIDIPAGTYPYDPDINLDINLGPGQAGEAQAFAVDADTFNTDTVDNYEQDNEPLGNALWSLTIGADMPTTSQNNVGVDFELNPVALTELGFPASYLSTLSYNSETTEAAAIDQSMDTAIASDMVDTAGEDDLTEVDPFPSGTTFTPEFDEEGYFDGVDASIEAPEPGTAALLAVGLGAAMMRRAKERREE